MISPSPPMELQPLCPFYCLPEEGPQELVSSSRVQPGTAEHVTSAKREVSHSPGSQHDALSCQSVFPGRSICTAQPCWCLHLQHGPSGLGSVTEQKRVLCEPKVRHSFPFCLFSHASLPKLLLDNSGHELAQHCPWISEPWHLRQGLGLPRHLHPPSVDVRRHCLFLMPSKKGWGDEVHRDSMSQARCLWGCAEGSALSQVPPE